MLPFQVVAKGQDELAGHDRHIVVQDVVGLGIFEFGGIAPIGGELELNFTLEQQAVAGLIEENRGEILQREAVGMGAIIPLVVDREIPGEYEAIVAPEAGERTLQGGRRGPASTLVSNAFTCSAVCVWNF